MTEDPVWLPIQAVIDIHAEQIAEHGGALGLRDQGLLEAALARPHQLFAYEDPPPDIHRLAAAYAWAICRNHPFVDGNKRVALLAIIMFLSLNGWFLDATERDAVSVILAAASGEIDEPVLADWIRRNGVAG